MLNEKEVWKDIEGYEGLYCISNYGRLKSLPRIIQLRNGIFRPVKGKILSVKHSGGWYLSTHLSKNGIKRAVRIHQLVVAYFLEQRPSNNHHIHHKDGNKQNNFYKNLEYVLPKDHSKITAKQNPKLLGGMINYNRHIRPKRVVRCDLNGVFQAEYSNTKEAAVATGVCQRNIHQVADKTEYSPGKTRRQAGGFTWKFKK